MDVSTKGSRDTQIETIQLWRMASKQKMPPRNMKAHREPTRRSARIAQRVAHARAGERASGNSHLEELADELLEMIARSLPQSTDLLHLAMTARSFTRIALNLLHMNIVTVTHSVLRPEQAEANVLRLLRNILQHPQSFDRVDRLCLHLPDTDQGVVDEYFLDRIKNYAISLGLRSGSHFSLWWRNHALRPFPLLMNYPQFRKTFQHDYYVLATETLLLKLPNLKSLEVEDSPSLRFVLFGNALPTQRVAILSLVPAIESVTIFTNELDCLNVFNFGILLQYTPSIANLAINGRPDKGEIVSVWAGMSPCPHIRKLTMDVKGMFRGTLLNIIHALPGLSVFSVRMSINDADILITSPTASFWADPLELFLTLSGSALATNLRRVDITNSGQPTVLTWNSPFTQAVVTSEVHHHMPNTEVVTVGSYTSRRP